MPARVLPDGLPCSDPENVVKGWLKQEVIADRARTLVRLLVSREIKGASEKKDSDQGHVNSKPILPTKANMITNAAVLEEVARNMSERDRVGADPIDVLCKMTLSYYEKNPLYTKVYDEITMKAVAYNDAWTIHKMISQFRGPVAKYSRTRVLCWIWHVFTCLFCVVLHILVSHPFKKIRKYICLICVFPYLP